MRYSNRQNLTAASESTSRLMRRGALWAVAGAALAASALLVRQRTREAEREHPPLGEFIDIAGVRLHYIERGEGPPLVFLHGNGSMLQDLVSSGLIDMAAKHHRVIAFDRPGYGYSERPRSKIWTPQMQAELLHRAMLYLDVEKPVIVGHSWGTLVAMSMALDFPQNVKSLVLLSGYYYPTARADVPVMSLAAVPVVGDLLRYTVSPWLMRLAWPALMHVMFGPPPVPERFSTEFPVWLALRPSQLRAAAAETAMAIPAVAALRHRYHELAMPVVIMAGNEDRYVYYYLHSERLHKELPQSTLHITQDAGHMLHHFAQHQVLEAIEQAGKAAVDAQPNQQDEAIVTQFRPVGRPAASLLH